MSRPFRRASVVLAGAALLLLSVPPAPASAHVTTNPDEANSPYANTSLRVPHGCDGSATTEVRVQIPDGVQSPKPEVVAGWEIEMVPAENGAEDQDGDGDDHGAGAAVAEVVWAGGNLPDNNFQNFGLNFQITDDAPEVLWFPTIQECEEGEHRWIEIPASIDEWGDLDEPAPYVINNMAGGGAEGDTGEDSEAADTTGDEAGSDPGDGAEAAAGGSDGTGPLPVIALIAGLLGLAAGATGLLVALRAGRQTPPAGSGSGS